MLAIIVVHFFIICCLTLLSYFTCTSSSAKMEIIMPISMGLSGLNEVVLIKHPGQDQARSRRSIPLPGFEEAFLTPLPSRVLCSLPTKSCRRDFVPVWTPASQPAGLRGWGSGFHSLGAFSTTVQGLAPCRALENTQASTDSPPPCPSLTHIFQPQVFY